MLLENFSRSLIDNKRQINDKDMNNLRFTTDRNFACSGLSISLTSIDFFMQGLQLLVRLACYSFTKFEYSTWVYSLMHHSCLLWVHFDELCISLQLEGYLQPSHQMLLSFTTSRKTRLLFMLVKLWWYHLTKSMRIVNPHIPVMTMYNAFIMILEQVQMHYQQVRGWVLKSKTLTVASQRGNLELSQACANA